MELNTPDEFYAVVDYTNIERIIGDWNLFVEYNQSQGMFTWLKTFVGLVSQEQKSNQTRLVDALKLLIYAKPITDAELLYSKARLVYLQTRILEFINKPTVDTDFQSVLMELRIIKQMTSP